MLGLLFAACVFRNTLTCDVCISKSNFLHVKYTTVCINSAQLGHCNNLTSSMCTVNYLSTVARRVTFAVKHLLVHSKHVTKLPNMRQGAAASHRPRGG